MTRKLTAFLALGLLLFGGISPALHAQVIVAAPPLVGATGDFPRVDRNLARTNLGLRVDQNQPAANTAPTVDYLTSGSTVQTNYNNPITGGVLNPNFGYIGSVPTQTGANVPDNTSVVWRLTPGLYSGSGNLTAEFYCDSPAVSFYCKDLNGGIRISVDDVEVARCVQAYNPAISGVTATGGSGTAQGGTSNTITLSASADTHNNAYLDTWVTIPSGTGAGQSRQILPSGTSVIYNGTTKVATVVPAWVTTPDSTSTYIIAKARNVMSATTGSGSNKIINIGWNGERRMRRYKAEFSGTPFASFATAFANDTIIPAQKRLSPQLIEEGDSYTSATGADAQFSGLGPRLGGLMGMETWDLGIGGTGYVNPGSSSTLVFGDRVLPPTNAWFVSWSNAAGSITLTQSGTTATIPLVDTAVQFQAALDSAFGTGLFQVAGYSSNYTGANYGQYWILGRGANASVTATMTLSNTGVTSSTAAPVLAQYLGDMAPWLQKDAAGNILPFYLLWLGGHNDTTNSNASYTASLLQTTATALYAAVRAKWPMCTQIVVGYMSVSPADVPSQNVDAALYAAAQTLPRINGKVPFIETIGNQSFGSVPSYITGTGSSVSPTGTGNADFNADYDDIHPNMFGHATYAFDLARDITRLLTTGTTKRFETKWDKMKKTFHASKHYKMAG